MISPKLFLLISLIISYNWPLCDAESTYRRVPPLLPVSPRNSWRLYRCIFTDGFLFWNAFERVHDEADNIYGGEHPNPLGLAFIPHQELFYVFADEDVDGLDERDGFVDGWHRGVDGHAIIGGVIEEDLSDERFEVLLCDTAFTSLVMDWLLWRYSPDSSPD